MARHRNIRSMNYSDEYDGYDDVYGHSVEEDGCISPSDAAQFLYNRDGKNRSIGSYLQEDTIAEADESKIGDLAADIDKSKLDSCIEKMKNVIGDTIPTKTLIEQAVKNELNPEKTLDAVLSAQVKGFKLNDENLETNKNQFNSSSNTQFSENDSSTVPTKSNESPNIKEKSSLFDLINEQNQKVGTSKLGLGKNINFTKKPLVNPFAARSPPESSVQKSESLPQSITSQNQAPTSLTELIKKHQQVKLESPSQLELNKEINFNRDAKIIFEANNKISIDNSATSLHTLVQTHLNLNDKTDCVQKSSIGSKLNESKPGNINLSLQYLQQRIQNHNKIKSNEKLEPSQLIDLTSALNITERSPVVTESLSKSETNDNFIYQFIDCEIPVVRKVIQPKLLKCMLNLNIKNSNEDIKKCSAFGKILCKRFRTHTPLLSIDEPAHKIQRFHFDTISPDDFIKKNLAQQNKN